MPRRCRKTPDKNPKQYAEFKYRNGFALTSSEKTLLGFGNKIPDPTAPAGWSEYERYER